MITGKVVKPLDLYRLVRVAEVSETKTHYDFSIEDSVVSFFASKKFLRSKGVRSITKGQDLFIKGRLGNEDVMLASPDALEDIRKG